jgi:hypothetical protein
MSVRYPPIQTSLEQTWKTSFRAAFLDSVTLRPRPIYEISSYKYFVATNGDDFMGGAILLQCAGVYIHPIELS